MNNETPSKAPVSPKAAPSKEPRSGKKTMFVILGIVIVALIAIALVALYRGKREKAFRQFVEEKRVEENNAFAEYLKANPPTQASANKEYMDNLKAAVSLSSGGDSAEFAESLKRAAERQEETDREAFRNQ